ncbi:MAG: hypothetical protein CL662_11055 [Bacteroidetes bacterium]|jgi:hypothetical protein|nr:hypothetical protein [Bacteroidota bacterium]HCI69692.1 hypothetical protein [Balneola sp.]|tara:strand:+ start:533 stop:778 length:246 start_codon:yes stop_codon:yes gene_type:complete
MKKINAKHIFSIFAFILVFVLSNSLNATVYQCDENGCVSTYNQGENGYTWSVVCDDGTHASGYTPGATYSGDCPEKPGGVE